MSGILQIPPNVLVALPLSHKWHMHDLKAERTLVCLQGSMFCMFGESCRIPLIMIVYIVALKPSMQKSITHATETSALNSRVVSTFHFQHSLFFLSCWVTPVIENNTWSNACNVNLEQWFLFLVLGTHSTACCLTDYYQLISTYLHELTWVCQL